MAVIQFLRTSTIRLHPDDDVVIAMRDLASGSLVEAEEIGRAHV